ncbi:MAG: 4Fe-4S binding protein [Methanospirillum sp.]
MDPRKALESAGGIITQRDPRRCIVRLRVPAGLLTPDQLTGLARAARKAGVPAVHLTMRQTLELPNVAPEALDYLLPVLEKNGTPLGAERNEVVNIVACPGTATCRLANIETYALAKELDRRFFGVALPVKMRIGISACPNMCAGERLCEIGITGIRRPDRNDAQCTGCGTCANTCREEAIAMINGCLRLDEKRCMACGMCIDYCPFDVIADTGPGYRITIGGRRGRHPVLGKELLTVRTPEEVVAVVGAVLDRCYRRAYAGRHFADQLELMDLDSLRADLAAGFNQNFDGNHRELAPRNADGCGAL